MANRILIITGVADDAKTLEKALSNGRDGLFAVKWVTELSAGLATLRAGGVDAIIVDLSLADSQGIDTFDQLYAAAPHTPILTLSAADDEPLTTTSVQHGAQGYLSKSNLDSYLTSQSLHNLIQRKAVEETYYLEKARAEITLNSISDAVIGTDLRGNVDYLNIAAESLTGWSREEARGRPIGEVMRIIDDVNREAKPNPVELVLQYNKAMALSAGTILIRRDGREAAIEDSVAPIHDWDGKLTGAVVVFHDVTASQAMALKMAHLAQHDFLTNLPNRVLLNDRVAQAIALAKRRGAHLALLFLDLDNFKHINDSLGHPVGDKLLQSVADRLCGCVRGSDTVSRQGGDEFVILVTEDKFAENAGLVADKILLAMAAPHLIDEHELHITTSIGISVYPEDGEDAETLLKNADTAMYSAKEKGRNNSQYFKNSMNIRVVERQAIETDLRHALQGQEFVLHYQPRIDLDTGAISGVEALLRWNHPQWGLVLPGRFVEIADSCGLMAPIGRWVLREACGQTKRWQEAGFALESISVNISAQELCCKGFVDGIRVILSETGLAPTCLQLEVTESTLMRDVESSIDILEQLQDMGVQAAVDDFGAGFSSLSYLTRFPINILKIAPAFVRDIGSANGHGIVAGAIIAMAVSLKQRVVAKGVEEKEQRAFLNALHCDEGQGYLFSKPLAAEQCAQLLQQSSAATAGRRDAAGVAGKQGARSCIAGKKQPEDAPVTDRAGVKRSSDQEAAQ